MNPRTTYRVTTTWTVLARSVVVSWTFEGVNEAMDFAEALEDEGYAVEVS